MHRTRSLHAGWLLLLALGACAPRARGLPGTPAPALLLPRATLPVGHTRASFRWEYEDADFAARGEGVVRAAAPDSARLDFFVDGGLGGGWAIVIGDELRAPGGDAVRRFLPPPPLLWAALGRFAVPAATDTTARVDGADVRADIGRDPVWRATFTNDRLMRLERIDGGRIVETVDRTDAGARYEHATARRRLILTVTRAPTITEFDGTIWRP